MATENQVNANRKNALKSTGPRTEEGKDASSQNATKHGLRAKRDVIKTENQDEFDIYRTKMLDDLSPDDAMEEMLAERIVSLSWRLKRAEHFQNAVVDALIEHGLHGASFGFGWTSENRERAQKEAADGEMDVLLGIVINHDFANAKTLEQLLVYERRIESSLYRTISELKKARKFKKTEFRDSGLVFDPDFGELSRTEAQTRRVARPPCSRIVAAGDSFYKDELQTSEICSCKSKPNSEETSWALVTANATDAAEKVHPTSDCTNEPNSMEENSGLAIRKGDTVAQSSLMGDTEDRISQAIQSNTDSTNEPKFEDNYSTGLQAEVGNLQSEILSDANSAISVISEVEQTNPIYDDIQESGKADETLNKVE